MFRLSLTPGQTLKFGRAVVIIARMVLSHQRCAAKLSNMLRSNNDWESLLCPDGLSAWLLGGIDWAVSYSPPSSLRASQKVSHHSLGFYAGHSFLSC